MPLCARRLLACLIGLMTPLVAFGQAAPADIDITPIHDRIPTQADRQLIAEWAAQQMDRADAAARGALVTYRQQLIGNYQARDAIPAFREAYVQICCDALLRGIQQPIGQEGHKPLTCAIALSVAGELQWTPAVDAALAGLQSAAPVVRERAAYCLGRLIGQVPGQQLGAIVNALGAAARQETSGTVLEAMYRALDIPAQAPAAFQAIVTALTERIPKYAAGDVRFARAETAAGVVLQHLVAAAGRQSIPQATLQDAVPPLARLLKLATLSFLAGPTPLMTERQRAVRQADLAGCVATIEGALGVVVHAVKTDVTLPSITSKLTQSAEAVATEVQLELNRWIGTADTPGVLNQAPFNLPAALPDTKLAPTATNPAPAGASATSG